MKPLPLTRQDRICECVLLLAGRNVASPVLQSCDTLQFMCVTGELFNGPLSAMSFSRDGCACCLGVLDSGVVGDVFSALDTCSLNSPVYLCTKEFIG